MIYLFKTLDHLYNVSHKEKSIFLIKDTSIDETLDKMPKKSWILSQLKQPKIKKSYINEEDSINLLRVRTVNDDFIVEAISKKTLLNTLLYSSIYNLSVNKYVETLKTLETIVENTTKEDAFKIAVDARTLIAEERNKLIENLKRSLYKNAECDIAFIRKFTLEFIYNDICNSLQNYATHLRYYSGITNSQSLNLAISKLKSFIEIFNLIKNKAINELLSKENEFNTLFKVCSDFKVCSEESYIGVLKYFKENVYNTTLFKSFNISKAVSELFKKDVDCVKGISSSEISDFSEDLKNILKQTNSVDSLMNTFSVIEGDLIPYYYNKTNYAYTKECENETDQYSRLIRNNIYNPYTAHRILSSMQDDYTAPPGILNKSCMRGKTGSDTLDIYSKNPNQVKMLIKKDSKGKVIGRCLLWHDDTGNKYFDRIYVNSAKEVGNFYKWLYANKYTNIYKGNEGYVGKNNTKDLISIKLDNVKFEKYPYMDSFIYLDPYTKTLYKEISPSDGTFIKIFNKLKVKFLIKMRNTSGSIVLVLPNGANVSIENMKVLHELSNPLTYKDLNKLFDNALTARNIATLLNITIPEDVKIVKQNKTNLLVETVFIPELKETVEINAYNIIKFNLTTIEALIKEKNYRIIAPYYDEHICKRFVCRDSLVHMNYINHIIATKCIENNPK